MSYWWESPSSNQITTVQKPKEKGFLSNIFSGGSDGKFSFEDIFSATWGVGTGIATGGIGVEEGSQIGGGIGSFIDNLLGTSSTKGKSWIGKPSENLYGFLFGNYGGEIYNPKEHPDWIPLTTILMNSYRINGFNRSQGDAEYEAWQIINGFKKLSDLTTEFSSPETAQAYLNNINPKDYNANNSSSQGLDNSNNKLIWFVVAGLGFVGFVIALVVVFSKKKKKD